MRTITNRIILFLKSIKKTIKKIISEIKRNNFIAILFWLLKKNYSSPPHIIKQRIVKKYAKKYSIINFIETGTYKGDMINAVKNIFKKIYSIELSPELFREAKKRFSETNNIDLHCGDSGMLLKKILMEIKTPTLFWLDAHYSKGETVKGETNTPVLSELETILNHKIKNHAILIDDARCFDGTNDYPKISEIKVFIEKRAPHYTVKTINDIIRITNFASNKNQ